MMEEDHTRFSTSRNLLLVTAVQIKSNTKHVDITLDQSQLMVALMVLRSLHDTSLTENGRPVIQ